MEKKTLINVIIDGITAIFLPIVNLLSAAGILKGIIAMLTTLGVLPVESGTYLVLNAMSDSLFYFLPMLLAYTAAKKFGANPFTAVVIAGVLLHPSMTAVLETGNSIEFFGVPLRGVTYHSSVIPIILAAGLLTFAQRFFNKILPELVRGFLTPLLCILFVGFVTLFAFGAVGAIIGDALAEGYELVYGISPVVAGLLLGATIQPMLIFGLQWSFILIAMNNITVSGHDTVLALIGPAVFAQAGAALAVMIKCRDKAFKSICLSAMVSAFFGITEPAMFGVNLPHKKPMAGVCIGGGIGGALAGLSGARAISFAFPSLASIPVFFGEGFGLYIVSWLVGFGISFIITMLLKFEIAPAAKTQAAEAG